MSIPRDLRQFYVVVTNDEVIAFAVNMSAFYRELKKIDVLKDSLKSQRTLSRYFKKNNILTYLGSDRKIYNLQKII